MASKAFMDVANAIGDSKPLDTVLAGNGYLGEGTYNVTVTAVDTAKLEEDQIRVTFTSEDGKSHNQTYFLLDKDKTGFGYSMRQFWSALFLDAAAIGRFLKAVGSDNAFFGVFTGMKLEITLQPGKGFRVVTLSDGTFQAQDGGKPLEISDGEYVGAYDSVKDAADAATGAGYKRAFMQVKGHKPTDTDLNIAALDKALYEKNKPAAKLANSKV